MKTRFLRHSLQTIILLLVLYAALGFGKRSVEAFCPFGGMESLWGLFKTGQFTCALGPLNLSMLVGILILTLIAKKAFCGWACPIGFLGEIFNKIGGKFFPKRSVVGEKLNSWLKLVRYLVLFVSLYFTFRLGELVLRGYDPFYAIFTGFKGHATLGWITIIVTVLLGIGSLFIPMFFCRYLCPLGATFDPFSRLGLIKITRNEETCTQCYACAEACPHAIAPHEFEKVRHRDCTNCLECIDACKEENTLELKLTV